MNHKTQSEIQAFVDGMNAAWRHERSKTQMTLGKLIAELESMPADRELQALDNEHSYRGYYSDLAFERADGTMLAGDFLDDCRECLGETFEGYKGGNFKMGLDTPIWIASYGCCGLKMIGINDDGSFATAEDE